TEVEQGILAGLHGVGFQLHEVDDAEMHLADRIRVVVEQGDDAVAGFSRQVQLFLDFPGNGGEIGGHAAAAFLHVHGIHVAAHTYGDFRVQAAFPARFSPRVVQHAVAVAEHAIGDDL